MDSVDLAILAVAFLLAVFYYWTSGPSASKSRVSASSSVAVGQKGAEMPMTSSSSRGFVDLMKRKQSQFIIFYGSQTGTAEDYASRMVKEAAQYGIRAVLADLMDYEMEDFAELPAGCLVAFVLATYGDGEPTDNAQDFYEWLMSDDRESGSLSHVNYLMFGLGNKTYTHFNAIARKADARLMGLGAKSIHVRGEGDDDADLEEDYMQWSTGMWTAACRHFKLDPSNMQAMLCRSFRFSVVAKSPDAVKSIYSGEHGVLNAHSGRNNRVTYDATHPFYAKISSTRPLFAPGLLDFGDRDLFRQCHHVEFDISGSSLRYQSGDHMAMYAPNDSDEVLLLARVLGLEAKLDHVFDMRTSDNSGPVAKRTPFPCPTTFRAALTSYIDISTLPRMHILALFARYATDETEKAHLKRISSIDTKHEYHDYIVTNSRNLRQVLEEHPSVQFSLDQPDEDPSQASLTIGDLFEILPRLQPRYYSISSSARVDSTSVHITASVVRYKTKLNRIGNGVATGHLHRLLNGVSSLDAVGRVPIFLRKSNFKLPRNSLAPVILVGPGTGVAPLRAFIHERQAILDFKIKEWYAKKNEVGSCERPWLHTAVSVSSEAGKLTVSRVSESTRPEEFPPVDKMIGDTLLFFGCRNREEDFMYAQEWLKSVPSASSTTSTEKNDYLHAGLTGLYCAFSRETSQKTYVQSLLVEQSENVWNLLSAKNGYVYVCGDAKNMARDVLTNLKSIATDERYGKMNPVDADAWIKKLKDSGRYQEDVWS
eukprot:Partr_v1_DN28020_c1_g1_i1_m57092 putative This enzyme is required for electron transfer from NADP to cytochrome P450 (By similarity)